MISSHSAKTWVEMHTTRLQLPFSAEAEKMYLILPDMATAIATQSLHRKQK